MLYFNYTYKYDIIMSKCENNGNKTKKSQYFPKNDICRRIILRFLFVPIALFGEDLNHIVKKHITLYVADISHKL